LPADERVVGCQLTKGDGSRLLVPRRRGGQSGARRLKFRQQRGEIHRRHRGVLVGDDVERGRQHVDRGWCRRCCRLFLDRKLVEQLREVSKTPEHDFCLCHGIGAFLNTK